MWHRKKTYKLSPTFSIKSLPLQILKLLSSHKMIQNDSSVGAILFVPILLLHILLAIFLSKGKMPEDKFWEDFCQKKALNEAKKHMGSFVVAAGALPRLAA